MLHHEHQRFGGVFQRVWKLGRVKMRTCLSPDNYMVPLKPMVKWCKMAINGMWKNVKQTVGITPSTWDMAWNICILHTHLGISPACWPCMLNKKLPFCKAISSSFNDCDEMQRRMRNHTRRKDWSWSVARKAESLVSNKRSWTYKTPQRSHVIPLIHSHPLQKP